MAHYLDPKNDLIFKRIFGRNEHLCMSLLNSMLPLEPGQQIVELKYQEAELVPEIPVLKNSIVDVHCTDNRGRTFIVEMQMYWTDSFKNRVLFNASKAYVMQLDKAKTYQLLQPVYALSFVNEIFDADPAVYYHDYKIVNIANSDKRIEGLEFVFIELPKFCPGNRAEKKLYDLWLTFLTQLDKEGGVPPALLEEEVTREALQYLESSSYTKGELEAYDRYWDTIRTERTYYLDAMNKGLADGRAEGCAKGRAEGLVEGRAEGEAIGMQKGIEKGKMEALIEIVRHAADSGIPVKQIQVLTGLSEEKIQELVKN